MGRSADKKAGHLIPTFTGCYCTTILTNWYKGISLLHCNTQMRRLTTGDDQLPHDSAIVTLGSGQPNPGFQVRDINNWKQKWVLPLASKPQPSANWKESPFSRIS